MGVRSLLAQYPMHKIRLDLVANPITTAAWTQVLAAAPAGCTAIQVAYTGIGILRVSKGQAGSETVGKNEFPFYIIPGGAPEMLIPVELPGTSRLSVRALDQNVADGELVINFFG